MQWIRSKLADHVGDHVVLSLEGAIMVTSPGTKSSYPRPPQSLNLSGYKLMGGNTTGEIEIGWERGLYKYINHQAGTTKASTRMILVQMYNIFRLLIGVPDYFSSESYGEKQKLIGLIVIISQRGVCKL